MTGPPLVAVAHGSRNTAAHEAIQDTARQISRLAPSLDVRVAFCQHEAPALGECLAAAGPGAVVVPLLLSTGYHLTTDIAGAAASSGARVAGPLGPDQLLAVALGGRLAEAGVPAGTPVVLAAAGSGDPRAAPQAGRQAELLADQLGVRVITGFAAAAQPTVGAAVEALLAETGGPVAVASYLMAPGDFHDQLQKTAAGWVTAPLAGHPAVAALVIDRYRVAASTAASPPAALPGLMQPANAGPDGAARPARRPGTCSYSSS